MQSIDNLSAEERVQLQENCAEKIFIFGKAYSEMKKIYEAYGYCIPVECWHNYKDSWFHFRKLYEKRDRISVQNEKYAMEEHLLRAWKDALVFFLQELSANLEVWYFINQKKDTYDCDDTIKQYAESIHACWEIESKLGKSINWGRMIMEKYHDKYSGTQLSKVYYWYYISYIASEQLMVELQQLIHNLKDLILRIRYGGTDIYRPTYPDEYLKELLQVLYSVNNVLEDKNMLSVVSSGIYVKAHLEKTS